MSPRRGRILLIFVLLLNLILSACQENEQNVKVTEIPIETPTTTLDSAGRVLDQVEIVRSQAQRETSPDVLPTDLKELVAGNSAFAFNLYQSLRGREGNLFYSPYGISVALTMIYAGARGETERQMANTLHYTLSQDRLHPVFNALDLELTSRNGEDFKLNIANAIWGQVGHTFLAEFLDVLAVNYGAGLHLLDFEREPETSRQTINDWISEKTEKKIHELISRDKITPDTRLLLTNAIYFNARWLFPFDEMHSGVFHTLDGEQVGVEMMTLTLSPKLAEVEDGVKQIVFPDLSYAQDQGYQAVELPYQSRSASMIILVPDAGQFDAFEASLSAELVRRISNNLSSRGVALTMPKFSYESEFSLAETLAEMGMPDTFSAADFSGIDGSQDLSIGDIFHKTFISVDEIGTEAAVTSVEILVEKVLPNIELVIDRPFIFIIRDIKTGAILFVGRVLDPKG